MKKIFAFVLAVVLSLALYGCGDQTSAQAKEAYENGDYETVVALLGELETLDEELQKMLVMAQANIAFSEKDYAGVIKLLDGHAYSAEQSIYTESLVKQIEAYFEDSNAKGIVSVAGKVETADEHIYTLITKACSEFDYAAFQLMDAVIESVPEGKLKDDLTAYSDENGKTRTKAFMKGDWQWINEGHEPRTVVNVSVFEDDEACFGLLVEYSDFMADYFYQANDMYWQKFVFANDVPVTVWNITRYNDGYGTISDNLAAVELNIEDKTMVIHVTGADTPDRIWEKIS